MRDFQNTNHSQFENYIPYYHILDNVKETPIHSWVTLLTRETFSKLDQGYDYTTTLVQRENTLKSIISLLNNLHKIELPWLRNAFMPS